MNRKALLTALALLLAALLLAGGPAHAIGNRRLVAFGLGGICTGCHGLPPVSPADLSRIGPGYANCAALDASSRNERCENYADGGGAHWRHVSFLRTKQLGEATGYDEQCGQCHGLDAGGSLWHLESDLIDPSFNWGLATWPVSFQQKVDLVDAFENFRAGGTARTSSYNGVAVREQAASDKDLNAKGGEPQECRNLNCHGAGAPARANEPGNEYGNLVVGTGGRLLWDAAQVSTTFGRDMACAGCHGFSAAAGTVPADLFVFIGTNRPAGTLYYVGTMASQGVTASYYGTVSGYSRGGHGDANINPSDDPSFVQSATGSSTPVQCTSCHNDNAAHFPPASSNPYRLTGVTSWGPGSAVEIENDICQSCHVASKYPGSGRHHPSYVGPTKSNPVSHDIVPHPSQEVYRPITTWKIVAELIVEPISTTNPQGDIRYLYEQDGYSAAPVNGRPDGGLDWWGGAPGNSAQRPAPKPVFYGEPSTASPKATLPLERYVLGPSSGSTSDRTLCVTCHNPHGTDLYVFEGTMSSFGFGKSISDNNMLRLRDSDNSLCDACH